MKSCQGSLKSFFRNEIVYSFEAPSGGHVRGPRSNSGLGPKRFGLASLFGDEDRIGFGDFVACFPFGTAAEQAKEAAVFASVDREFCFDVD